jgi:hypothetical protein
MARMMEPAKPSGRGLAGQSNVPGALYSAMRGCMETPNPLRTRSGAGKLSLPAALGGLAQRAQHEMERWQWQWRQRPRTHGNHCVAGSAWSDAVNPVQGLGQPKSQVSSYYSSNITITVLLLL